MKIMKCLAVMAFLAVVPCASYAGSASPTITVSGEAVLRIDPDVAHISVHARLEDKDKARLNADLQKEVSVFTDYLINELKLKKEDVIAESVSIYPHYDYSDKEPVLTGYEGSRSVRITLGNFDLISQIVARAMEQKSITLDNISYGLKDPASFADRVRDLAIADSLKKAKSIAARYNSRLLHIERITYDQDSNLHTVEYAQSNRMMTKSMGVSSASDSSYYQAKKIELRDSINVSFAVKAGSLE